MPNARDLLLQGDEMAARQQFSSAIAIIFKAATYRCAESGIAPYTPTFTAGEYARTILRARHDAGEVFAIIGRLANTAAFCSIRSSENEWTQARSAFVLLDERLGSRP